MAIDAIVTDVEHRDGGTWLVLQDPPGRFAGQTRLEVLDAPKGLRALIGEHLWGNSRDILYRDRVIAERVGYAQIRFTRPAAPSDAPGGET